MYLLLILLSQLFLKWILKRKRQNQILTSKQVSCRQQVILNLPISLKCIWKTICTTSMENKSNRSARRLFQLLLMTKSSMLVNARTTCVRLKKFWNCRERVTSTLLSNNSLSLSMHVPNVKVSQSNIAVKDASNKTGSKSTNLSAVVKCQKLEILCCCPTCRELKPRLLLSRKLTMRAASRLNSWVSNSFWAISTNQTSNLSRQEKQTSAKAATVKFNSLGIKLPESKLQ